MVRAAVIFGIDTYVIDLSDLSSPTLVATLDGSAESTGNEATFLDDQHKHYILANGFLEISDITSLPGAAIVGSISEDESGSGLLHMVRSGDFLIVIRSDQG